MTDKKKQYRLLRVLEYTGDEAFIQDAINGRSVKGTHVIGDNKISEAIIGDTYEILDDGGSNNGS